MLEQILKELLTTPKEGVRINGIRAGERAVFNEQVSYLLEEYSKNHPNGNKKWIMLSKVLKDKRRPYFSVLHVADERSYYPKGTVVLEIAINEDIEVRGDMLIPC